MSARLENEETEAIREIAEEHGAASSAQDVAVRDFHQPRRLSAARLRRISSRVTASFQDLASRLRPLLRQSPKLTLCSVSEVSSSAATDHLEAPFLVQCFRCEGEMGWLVWDSAYAAAAAEAILTGSFDGEPSPRKLSAGELCVVSELLSEFTSGLARRFEFQLETIQTVQDHGDLADLAPSVDTVEPRLRIHIQIETVGGRSDLCVYLGGFKPDEEGHMEAEALPLHLTDVPVTLRAYLGSVDVTLNDLLGLEVGDVIPLDVPTGSPIEMYVEDRLCAKAHIGRAGKKAAVSIVEIDPRAGEVEPSPDS